MPNALLISHAAHADFVCLYRLIRAMQLDFLKIHLPREKWVVYEQDIEYRYLDPYMKEIEAERAEIQQFGCRNYSDDDWPADEVK